MNIDKNLIKYWGMLFESEEAKDRNAVLPLTEEDDEIEIDAEIEEVPDEEASKSDENLEEEDKDYTASDILKVKRILNTFQVDESVLKRGFGFGLSREEEVDKLFENKFDGGRNIRMWMNVTDILPKMTQRSFDDIFNDGSKSSPYQLVSLVYLTENNEIGFRSFVQEKSNPADIGFIFNMKFPMQKKDEYKTKDWIREEDKDGSESDEPIDEGRKPVGEMGFFEYTGMNLATYKQFLLPYIMLIDSMSLSVTPFGKPVSSEGKTTYTSNDSIKINGVDCVCELMVQNQRFLENFNKLFPNLDENDEECEKEEISESDFSSVETTFDDYGF